MRVLESIWKINNPDAFHFVERAKEMLLLAKQELHSAQYAKIKSTKMRYDQEHKDSLSKYPELEEPLQSFYRMAKR